MSIISLDQVSKSVQSGNIFIDIMKGVSLQVAEHEHLAITGPSGSGKTTLLNIISGIDIPSEGTVHVFGKEISKLREEQRVQYRDQSIGMVFQDFCLFPGLTALENVKLFKPAHLPLDSCVDMLAQVGLSSRLNTQVTHLSGGEKQRVAIARAMIKSPDIILADEPTAQLDRHTAQSVMDLFFQLRQTKATTMVLITHDLSIAQRCDRMVSMESLINE